MTTATLGLAGGAGGTPGHVVRHVPTAMNRASTRFEVHAGEGITIQTAGGGDLRKTTVAAI